MFDYLLYRILPSFCVKKLWPTRLTLQVKVAVNVTDLNSLNEKYLLTPCYKKLYLLDDLLNKKTANEKQNLMVNIFDQNYTIY